MTPIRETPPDALIEDVRQRRRALLSSCDNDMEKLFAKIEALQRLHPEKLADRRTKGGVKKNKRAP